MNLQITLTINVSALPNLIDKCKELGAKIDDIATIETSKPRRSIRRSPIVNATIFRKIKNGESLTYSKGLLSEVRTCKTFKDFQLLREQQRAKRKASTT